MSSTAKINKEVSVVVKQAETIQITDSSTMKKAVEFLSKLNITRDNVITEKEKLTQPLNEALKEVRKRYKPFEELLDGAIATVRRAMTVYQTEADRKAQEEREAIAQRVGDGKGKFKPETAVRKMESVDAPEESVSTDAGTVQFKQVKKFEIEKPQLLPREYLIPDEAKIKEAMKNGVTVPGVRYFTEQIPVNYR